MGNMVGMAFGDVANHTPMLSLIRHAADPIHMYPDATVDDRTGMASNQKVLSSRSGI
jgi:hypothetical protein